MTSACRRIPRAAIAALLLLSLTLGVQAQVIEDSVDVGGAWVGSMVYSSREDVVYGLSNSGNFVFAIDCSSNQVIARVEAYYPRWLTYDSTDNKLYCSFVVGGESLLVIDGQTHQRIRALRVPGASLMVWDPVANRLYVGCTLEDEVVVIDCATDSMIAHIPVGRGPLKVHLNSRHRRLYVQNHDSETVSIIDLETLRVIRTMRPGQLLHSGCYCPLVDKYYFAGGDIWVVDGVGDTVLGTIPVPSGLEVRAMMPSGIRPIVVAVVYTGVAQVDTAYALDAEHDTLRHAVPIGWLPETVLWSPISDGFYCTCAGTGDVRVISGDGSRVRTIIDASYSPFAFALAVPRRRIYLGHLGSQFVYVIRDTVTAIAEGDLEVGRNPHTQLRVHPSPFKMQVWIEDPAAESRELLVYTESGRLVRTLKPHSGASAARRYCWDGRDTPGRTVPPGVYIVVAGERSRCRAKVVKLE